MKAVNLNPVHPIMKTIIEYKSENRRLAVLIKTLETKVFELNQHIHQMNKSLCYNLYFCDFPDYEVAKEISSHCDKLLRDREMFIDLQVVLRKAQRNNGEIILRNRTFLQQDCFGL